MAYNPGIQDTAFQSFAAAGPRFAANFAAWREERERKAELEKLQSLLGRGAQDRYIGTGEEFPGGVPPNRYIGTGEEFPMGGGPPMNNPGLSPSGANQVYSGQPEFNQLLNSAGDKEGLLRFARKGRTL